MAVLLGAIKISSAQAGKKVVEKAKKMYSGASSFDYSEFLQKHINHPDKKTRLFIREKFEKSVNPKGNSFIKIQIKKLYK